MWWLMLLIFWLSPVVPVPYRMTDKWGKKMFLKITVLCKFSHYLKVSFWKFYKFFYKVLFPKLCFLTIKKCWSNSLLECHSFGVGRKWKHLKHFQIKFSVDNSKYSLNLCGFVSLNQNILYIIWLWCCCFCLWHLIVIKKKPNYFSSLVTVKIKVI